ncbi:protein CNPPD1-like [Hydractinia symbiolongicarpus]|uniref:protein CNPPD1-like n=1 Tax=Hydractinia symbiolongicarpus TaxID=13093 RepID=UPI00254E019D|nr:protein CNPPD1-like [Hydractinia symbiolongicarpus]
MTVSKKNSPYFTWGCADDLAFRLKKTLYCSEDNDCYESSSVALTDVAVSMLLDTATCSRRKITQRYASSLTRQLPISPCALMMGILYSERLRQLNPSYLERVSSSDIYVVSMLVATKFLHDEGEEEEIFNNEWAEAAGLAVSTVNKLEREFLDAMNWNAYVSPSDFLDFCTKMETKIAFKYGLQRGWFSYTDLTQFLAASPYQKILKGIIESTVKIIGGCALVYGMSLSLLATSVMCYTATTSVQQVNELRPEQVSSSNYTTSASASYRPFENRCLTRTRRNQPIDQSHGDALDDDTMLPGNETELENLLRHDKQHNITSINVTHSIQSRNSCQCVRDISKCFESPFRYLHYQTSLHLSVDFSYARAFCSDFFDLDPGNYCECNSETVKSTTYRDQYDFMNKVSIGRKIYEGHVVAKPTLFGMLVM